MEELAGVVFNHPKETGVSTSHKMGLSRHDQGGHHEPRGGGHKQVGILVLGSWDKEVV